MSIINTVNHHPFLGSILGALVSAKIVATALNNSRWMSHQAAEISLAKAILENQRANSAEEATHLRRWVQIKEVKIGCVRQLSKAPFFIPLTIVLTALYLDDKITNSVSRI